MESTYNKTQGSLHQTADLKAEGGGTKRNWLKYQISFKML